MHPQFEEADRAGTEAVDRVRKLYFSHIKQPTIKQSYTVSAKKAV